MAVEHEEKHGQNRFLEGFDVGVAAGLLDEEIARWGERESNPLVLLRAICSLVRRSGSSGANCATFETKDIAQAIDPATGFWGRSASARASAPEVQEEISRTIRGAWKKLELRYQDAIHDAFERLGSTRSLALKKVRSKGGRHKQARYGLELADLSQRGIQYRVPAGGIRYRLEDRTPTHRVFKPLADGFGLSGWRVLLLAAPLALVATYAVVAATVSLVALWAGPFNGHRIATITITAISVAWLVRPFWQLAHNRITHAPWWMQPLKIHEPDDHILEIIAGEKGEPNTLRMSRYRGDCPVCAGTVQLESGRREFFYRQVGRCRRAPNEHVFSFDPVSRTGAPLRNHAEPEYESADVRVVPERARGRAD